MTTGVHMKRGVISLAAEMRFPVREEVCEAKEQRVWMSGLADFLIGYASGEMQF